MFIFPRHSSSSVTPAFRTARFRHNNAAFQLPLRPCLHANKLLQALRADCVRVATPLGTLAFFNPSFGAFRAQRRVTRVSAQNEMIRASVYAGSPRHRLIAVFCARSAHTLCNYLGIKELLFKLCIFLFISLGLISFCFQPRSTCYRVNVRSMFFLERRE